MENENKLIEMFNFRTKHHKKIDEKYITSYKKLFYHLKKLQREKKISLHPENNYLNNNNLAKDIYFRKYFLKDMQENRLEDKPEDVFLRLASYIASVEEDEKKQFKYAERFYEILYKGYFLPGGRVIAGAGDLFRLKTLANCFVTVIQDDNIESIYNAAYDCARTYSYGGGIGVDISSLRPKDSIVHNAADKSTGAVSFMELYSLTTGLIGQSGRRGALMLTIDVKHPDVIDFINVKQNPNWITKQIVEQCKWSNKFNDEQLQEIQKQVRENTQVRFANISLKVSDEFMNAVEETKLYPENNILVYKKLNKDKTYELYQNGDIHYSYKIPSKDINKYQFSNNFNSIEELNNYLSKFNVSIKKEDLKDINKRDVFGDLIVSTNEEYDLAIHYTGDFLTYFGSENTKSIKNLINVKEIWNNFVKGNYNTAEPGLIFWDTMRNYSPSDYMGKKISSTNPCFSKDNFVLTDKGPRQIADVINKKINVIVDDKIIKTQGFFSTGKKEVYEIKTEEGFKIKLTNNHLLNKENNWTEVKNLKKGDKLKLQFHNKIEWKGEGTFDEGFLLGLLVGDGTFSDNMVKLSVWNDDKLKKIILKKLKPFMKLDSYEGWDDKFQENKWNIKSKYLTDIAKKYNVLPKTKEITKEIETASYNFQRGFINGFFSADGCVQHSKYKGYRYLRLNQSNLKRLEVVQRMLAKFGIYSKIYLRRNEEEKIFPNNPNKAYKTKKNYEISITKKSLVKFNKIIGCEGYKKEKLKEIANSFSKGPYNEDWDVTIKQIKKIGKEEVYDIKVPGENRLDVNGFDAHNCGEIPLEDGGACNLASLNLSRFVKNGYTDKAEIDWENFKTATKDVVRFLDNVITWNIALNPLEKQRDAAKDTRRLGIGLMGIADMLNQLGLGYDSDEALHLIEEFSKKLANYCYIASAELAKEKEPIPIWDYKKYSKCPFFIERLDDDVKELIKKNGLRNIALLSIAPTGTISNVILGYNNENKNYIGVSGGIEPIFALFYTRRSEQMNEGAFYKVFHSTVQAYIDQNKLNEKIKNVNDVEELKTILPKHFFRTSHYINPETRVKVQGLCQKYIDHSISSTVNLPESVSPEVISKIYLDAWKKGLKGITIYRDGSRFPILSVQQEISEFQEFKNKMFKVYLDEIKIMKGDEIFMYNNKLLTPFHAIKEKIKIEEVDNKKNIVKETKVFKYIKDQDDDDKKPSKKACKVEYVNGKLVKNCGD
jgi:ribonucleotide reductase alpha subunit